MSETGLITSPPLFSGFWGRPCPSECSLVAHGPLLAPKYFEAQRAGGRGPGENHLTGRKVRTRGCSRMKLLRIAALGAALALVAAGPHPGSAARAAKADKSRNVRHVAFFGFSNKTKDYFAGGTDIDFSGRWVYAMQQGNRGGVHVIDASRRRPRKVSFIPCPGEQNDVAVVKRGLIALGYHNSTCAGDS